MAERVTIQDIADALGVSRNTVSKAINNTGVLSEETRKKVLAKAIEMGYKQFSYVADLNLLTGDPAAGTKCPAKTGEIALISTWFLNASHFSSTMLDKFQFEMSNMGYSMSMHVARPEEIRECRLPASLQLERCAGILCIEMFDYDYAQMLCGLGLPLLFVDAPVVPGKPSIPADLLLMNNYDCIFDFILKMKEGNIKKIGFVGEYLHCRSFFERYMAFRNGMVLGGLAVNEEWNILGNTDSVRHPDSGHYKDYLRLELKRMRNLPEVFICANDFVAIDLMQTLKELNVRIPDDVQILGFDDSAESRIISPALSTVHIHSQVLGISAAQLMLSRINDPELNYRSVYCETNLILRNSTKI